MHLVYLRLCPAAGHIATAKKFTNHSARKTVVSKLKKANVERSGIVRVNSLRSRRKRGRGRGARTREKNGGLGARDEGTPATKTPYFFISAAASGRKLLIG